jgi:acyl-CoA thioesterase YciA
MIDKCLFKRPAKEGQLIKIYGEVKSIGTTSITVYMEARSHNVYSGAQATILSTDMKFVRIDETGDAIPISDRVKNKFNLK